MAVKQKTELQNQSDNTFKDSPVGNITPPFHRAFNDDLIDSVATLKDDNTFENTQTIDVLPGNDALYCVEGDIYLQGGDLNGTGGGVYMDTAKFKVLQHTIEPITITASSSTNLDLLNVVQGNFIKIINPSNALIGEFAGGIEGVIIYATFLDPTDLYPNGATAPLSLDINDTLIFQFTGSNIIHILGLRRATAQEYFILANYAAYDNLRTNELFQYGSEYVLEGYYEYPTDNFWDVRLRAKTNADLDPAGYIRKNGEWIPVLFDDFTLNPGTAKINGFTNYSDQLSIVDYYALATQPQWDKGGSPIVTGASDNVIGADFYSRGFVGINPSVQKINLLNIGDSATAFFGRILQDFAATNKFYSHHGSSINQWGNNPYGYENGINAVNVINDNSANWSNEIDNLIINGATYFVVNNSVTINVACIFETKFNTGVQGHEAQFYFPLPFECIGASSGHGSLRFNAIANHENIGAIVIQDTSQSNYWCMVAAKWNNVISTATEVELNFSFTYLTAS